MVTTELIENKEDNLYTFIYSNKGKEKNTELLNISSMWLL